ncbi:MAG: cold-shock protein [Notoacmeibacter sp.]|nr:cold-shock protein [Notoacmeibacter sp.]
MHIGFVKSYDGRKGYGFIEPSDGSKEIYVHISALDRANLGGLVEGQKLRFDIEKDDTTGRMAAANLRLI